MRYAPLKLATICIGGSILWLTVLYLINRLLSLPIWLSYGLFALLTATLLFFIFRRYQFAMQYLRVFNDHPIPMWIYEYGTLRFLAVNQATIEKYGYSRKEFLSMTIKDIRGPEEVDKLLENVRLHCNGVRYRGIWKHRKKDGTDFFVELYAHDGCYSGKRARIIMAVDIDVQIKETQEAQDLAQRYDLLVKATNDAIFEWDAQQDLVVWNHGLYSIFGYAPAAAATSMGWWQEKLHPEDKAPIQEAFLQKLQSPDNYFEAQYRLACADGGYKTVLCRAYIIREQEQAVRVVGLIQDIDHIVEKKQIIQRLQEQNEGLREIARINSHEVRRPVVSILGITQLFDKSNEDKSLNNQLIDWLHTSTSELDEIIHKLEEKVREIEKN